MNQVLIAYVLLRLLCAGLAVGGVFVLFGTGWALIAGGAFALELAETLRRGMTPDEIEQPADVVEPADEQ